MEWIKIDGDNLPEYRIRTLLCVDGNLVIIGWLEVDDKWYSYEWDFEKDYSGLSQVTHWMPLPEFPNN